MPQDQPYLKPLPASSMASSYFAPLQQRQKSVEFEELDQLKKEKISCLHSRLHQEADKISKWKTRVEMEIKQKDGKIQESNHTIESLRKSILELQLQNESLSLKLQEEIANREEILQKIAATRTMCNLLKEYAAKLEDRMQRCETSRTELKYQEKEHLKSFEVLSDQFKELQAVSVENYNTLTVEVETEKEAKKVIEKKYKEQIIDAEQELKKLLQMTAEKDTTIDNIEQKVGRNEEEICKLLKDRNHLLERLNETSKIAEVQLRDIAEKDTILKSTREEKERLDAQLEEVSMKLKDLSVHNDKMSVNFTENEQLYSSKISKLQEELLNHQHSLQMSVERVQMLEVDQRQNQQVIEELKSAKDMLQLDRAEMQKFMEKTAAEKDQIENELKIMHQQSNDLSSSATEKDKLLQELRVQIANQEAQFSRVTTALEKVHQHLAKAQEVNTKVKTELSATREESKKQEKQIQKLEKEKEGMSKEIGAMQTEYDAVCSEKQKITQDLKDVHESIIKQNDELAEIRSYVEKLESEKENHTRTSNSMLKEESKNAQGLAKQLEMSKKETSDLDGKVTSLKHDVTTKNKQIKDLEKEAKAAKKEMNAKEKKTSLLEGKLEENEQSLVYTKEAMEEIIAEKSKLDEMVEIMKADKVAAEEKVALLEKTTTEAVLEKEVAQKELDSTSKQMAKTIQDYKLENEKVLQYRIARVEELKAVYEEKTKDLAVKTKDSGEHEEAVRKLEQIVDERSQKLSDLEKTHSELKATYEDLQKTVDNFQDLERTNSEEISRLNSELKTKTNDNETLKKEIKTTKADENAKKNKKVTDLVAKNAALKSSSTTQEKAIELLKESESEKMSRIDELNSEVITKDQEIEDLKKQLALTESKMSKEFSTPKTQNILHIKSPVFLPSFSFTPSRLPKTPQSNVRHSNEKTPMQSSVRLQPTTSSSSSLCIPKRRKVAFTPTTTPKSPPNNNSNSDSDCMEVDIDEVKRRMTSSSGALGRTPLIRKSMTPKTPSTDDALDSPRSSIVLKPKPRGPPVSSMTMKARSTNSPVKKTSSIPIEPCRSLSALSTPGSAGKKTKVKKPLSDELEKFNALFPSVESDDESKNAASLNVRATPSRAPGKFFKSRERQKLTKAGRTQKENNQSWVDLDAVFGFGSED